MFIILSKKIIIVRFSTIAITNTRYPIAIRKLNKKIICIKFKLFFFAHDLVFMILYSKDISDIIKHSITHIIYDFS